MPPNPVGQDGSSRWPPPVARPNFRCRRGPAKLRGMVTSPRRRRAAHALVVLGVGAPSVPGVELQAATKENLRRWFKRAHRALGRRDTLLLYVTDHGQKNAEDTLNNSITLWGPKESLSVSELRELLRMLRPGVRVVMLMSQCYSGAFAHLVAVEPDAPPTGNLCGYFSSTADRPAYGCYP